METKKICIYCMGEYGIKLCYALHDMGHVVNCFGDKDKAKCGYAILGITCVHYEEVCSLDKSEYMIVVAKKSPEPLIEHFKRLGFQTVCSDKELLKNLSLQNLPLKKYYKLKEIEEALYYLKKIKKACYCSENNMNQSEYKREEMQQMLLDCVLRKQNEYC